MVFLTKQNEKSGLRAPVIGFSVQANDITDNANKGNTLSKRVSFNLTSTFSISGL